MPYDGQVKNGMIYIDDGPQGPGWYPLSSTGPTQGPGTTDTDTSKDPIEVGTTKPGPNGTTLVYMGYGQWELYRPPTGGGGSTPHTPGPSIVGHRPGPEGTIITMWSDGSETQDTDPSYKKPPTPGPSIVGHRPGPPGTIITTWSDGSETQDVDPNFNKPKPPGLSIKGYRPGPAGFIITTWSDGSETQDLDPAYGKLPTTKNVTTTVTDMGGGLQLVVLKDQDGNVISSQVMNKAKKPVTSQTTTQTDIGNNKVRMDTRDQDGTIIDSQVFDKALTPQEELDIYKQKKQVDFEFAKATAASDFERQSKLQLQLEGMREAANSAELKARLDNDIQITNLRLAGDARLQADRLKAEADEAQKNRDFTKAENLLNRALEHELQAERLEADQIQGNLNRATSLKQAAMGLQQRAGEVLGETLGRDPFRFALLSRGQPVGDRPTPVTQFQDKLREIVNAPLPNIPAQGATLAESQAAYNQAQNLPTNLPVPTGFGLKEGGAIGDIPTLALVGEEGPEAALLAPGSAVEPLKLSHKASESKMESAARKALPKLKSRLLHMQEGGVIPVWPLPGTKVSAASVATLIKQGVLTPNQGTWWLNLAANNPTGPYPASPNSTTVPGGPAGQVPPQNQTPATPPPPPPVSQNVSNAQKLLNYSNTFRARYGRAPNEFELREFQNRGYNTFVNAGDYQLTAGSALHPLPYEPLKVPPSTQYGPSQQVPSNTNYVPPPPSTGPGQSPNVPPAPNTPPSTPPNTPSAPPVPNTPQPNTPSQPNTSPAVPGSNVVGIRDMPFYQILLKDLLGDQAANTILGNRPYRLNTDQLGALGVASSVGPTNRLGSFQPYGELLTIPGQNSAPVPAPFKWASIFQNLYPDEQTLLLSALRLAGGTGATDENALSQIRAATFSGPGR